jgi:hypothetical protein
MTITAWRLDEPPTPSAAREALTGRARAHGYHPCPNGCGVGFRCPSCGHYRHDTTPHNGYRCGRCAVLADFINQCMTLNLDHIETEHVIAYLAVAINTGSRTPIRQLVVYLASVFGTGLQAPEVAA